MPQLSIYSPAGILIQQVPFNENDTYLELIDYDVIKFPPPAEGVSHDGLFPLELSQIGSVEHRIKLTKNIIFYEDQCCMEEIPLNNNIDTTTIYAIFTREYKYHLFCDDNLCSINDYSFIPEYVTSVELSCNMSISENLILPKNITKFRADDIRYDPIESEEEREYHVSKPLVFQEGLKVIVISCGILSTFTFPKSLEELTIYCDDGIYFSDYADEILQLPNLKKLNVTSCTLLDNLDHPNETFVLENLQDGLEKLEISVWVKQKILVKKLPSSLSTLSICFLGDDEVRLPQTEESRLEIDFHSHLKFPESLRKLYFSQCKIANLVIGHHFGLEEIEFYNCDIDPGGFDGLPPNLEFLNLSTDFYGKIKTSLPPGIETMYIEDNQQQLGMIPHIPSSVKFMTISTKKWCIDDTDNNNNNNNNVHSDWSLFLKSDFDNLKSIKLPEYMFHDFAKVVSTKFFDRVKISMPDSSTINLYREDMEGFKKLCPEFTYETYAKVILHSSGKNVFNIHKK